MVNNMENITKILAVISILAIVLASSAMAYTYTVVDGISNEIAGLRSDLSIALDEISTIADASGISLEKAKLIQAAKQEGTVVWYNGMSLDSAEVVRELFMKKYGINVEMFRASTGTLATKIDQELASLGKAQCDVTFGDPGVLYEYLKQGLILSYESPEEQDIKPELIDPNHYDHSCGVLMFQLGYNTEFIEEPPSSWLELTNPQYKGKLAMFDPNQATYMLTLWSYWNTTYGLEWYDTILANEPSFGTTMATTMAIATGEKWIGPVGYDEVKPLIDKGMPIQIAKPNDFNDVFPALGSTIQVWETAEHPNAAKLLIDFVLSYECQIDSMRILGKNMFFFPARMDIPVDPYWEIQSMEEVQTYVEPPADRAANRQDLLDLWDSYFS